MKRKEKKELNNQQLDTVTGGIDPDILGGLFGRETRKKKDIRLDMAQGTDTAGGNGVLLGGRKPV